MEIPKFLQPDPNTPLSPEAKRYTELEFAYEKRFGILDWGTFDGDISMADEIKAMEICLKKGKPMRKIRPEWYKECPPGELW